MVQVVKNLPAKAWDASLIPGLGRSSGGGDGNPLQYSCLENSMDRGDWRATVHGVTKSWAWLSTHPLTLLLRTQHFYCRGPTWVQSLVGKLRSHKLHGWPKKIKIKKNGSLMSSIWKKHTGISLYLEEILKHWRANTTLLFATGNFFPKWPISTIFVYISWTRTKRQAVTPTHHL